MVFISQDPPFVQKVNISSPLPTGEIPKELLQGFCIDLIEALSKHAKFHYKIYLHQSYGGLVEELKKKVGRYFGQSFKQCYGFSGATSAHSCEFFRKRPALIIDRSLTFIRDKCLCEFGLTRIIRQGDVGRDGNPFKCFVEGS